MLSYIKISDYILIKNFEGYFNNGFTTITGETGAGKSMILSAIDLVCGKRISFDTQKSIREKADIIVQFNIANNDKLKKYLQEKDLYSNDECILRRVIHKDGRNFGFINDVNVSLKEMAYVSSHLIEIHSQDSTKNILNDKNQIRALDDYLNISEKSIELKYLSRNYYDLKQKIANKEGASKESLAQFQLLEYKYNELKELNLLEGEYDDKLKRFNDLIHSKSFSESCEKIIQILDNDTDMNISNLMSLVLKEIHKLNIEKKNVQDLLSMFNDMRALLSEINNSVNTELNDYDIDGDEFKELESRILEIESIAKKNNVSPEGLYKYAENIFEEYSSWGHDDDDIDEMKLLLDEMKSNWYSIASDVSAARNDGVDNFNHEIMTILSELKMEHAEICVEMVDSSHEINEFGVEKPLILIKTNLGQDFERLDKTLSGGEASRFSLAIQSILKDKNKTIVFDEIDTGIGGITSNNVGKYMLKISKNTQVLAITHVPQVALFSDHQFVVKKNPRNSEKITNVIIEELGENDLILEISRMFGHPIMDKNTKEQIKQMRLERRGSV